MKDDYRSLLIWVIKNLDLVDGDFYYKEDEEGVNPMNADDVVNAYYNYQFDIKP